jgi:PD-(D/E)XK nuclease superfamily
MSVSHTKQLRNEETDWSGLEELAKTTVDCGFKVHDKLGPGLLESAYEMLFFEALPSLDQHRDG